MATTALRHEERIGLGIAVALHAALVVLLVVQPESKPVVAPPERMTVTISTDVGLTSTSPEPAARAAPDIAPTLGEPAPAEPEPQPVLPPVARPDPAPRPAPRAAPSSAPRPQPRAQPRPKPKAAPKRQEPAPKAQPPAKAAQPAAKAAPKQSPRQAGGSRIGEDFLKGVEGAQDDGPSRNPPAQTIGPNVRSSLAGAISRQLKPKWAAPSGADADKLVTVLSWSLNRDGSLASGPTVVRQEGITDANRPQADRHAEQAVRAVRLAAPFDLPEEYYDAWKRVASFRFDRKLSQ